MLRHSRRSGTSRTRSGCSKLGFTPHQPSYPIRILPTQLASRDTTNAVSLPKTYTLRAHLAKRFTLPTLLAQLCIIPMQLDSTRHTEAVAPHIHTANALCPENYTTRQHSCLRCPGYTPYQLQRPRTTPTHTSGHMQGEKERGRGEGGGWRELGVEWCTCRRRLPYLSTAKALHGMCGRTAGPHRDRDLSIDVPQRPRFLVYFALFFQVEVMAIYEMMRPRSGTHVNGVTFI